MTDQHPRYVEMPNGTYVEWPEGVSAEEFKVKTAHLAQEEAPPDTRNAIQKSFDKETATSPSDSTLGTLLKSTVGAIGTPFVHPIDTAAGMIQAVRHPLDTAHAEVDQMYADKAAGGLPYAAAKFAGNAIGSVALGEAGGAAIRTLPKPSTALGRAALLGKTPEAAYESALKPSTTLSQAERAAIVKTGLEHEIPVSKEGIERLGDLIDEYNHAIKSEISANPTRLIDPNKVATRADQAKARFYQQVNRRADLNAIESSRQEFLDQQGRQAAQPTGLLDAQGNPIMRPAQAAPPMSAVDAQAMKQGTYSVLRGKYGEQGSASVEAQKALARGLKEEIATQFPEIAKLNAQESRLLDLQSSLERAVARTSNHQTVSIGTPIVGTAAKALTGSSLKAVAIALVKAVIDNPEFKSKLAIAVSKGGKIPYSQALQKVQAYSSAVGLSAGSQAGTRQYDSPAPGSAVGGSDATASPGWSH